MKNNKKSNNFITIDKYEQPIYVPNNLYVIKNYNKQQLDKMFEYIGGDSIYFDDDTTLAMTCYGVVEKKTNKRCIVVLLTDDFVKSAKKDIFGAVDICSHEAFHVADRVFEYCGLQLTCGSEEAYAFFVGWATKCIYKTLIK